MHYTIAIPAKFAAEFAAGSVALMTTSTGITTSLVSTSTGTVVGWAALVEASGVTAAATSGAGSAGAAASGSGGAAAVAAGGLALGPVLVIGLGAAALAGLGAFLWRRSHKAAEAAAGEMVEMTVECGEADAEAVLAEVRRIVEAAAARIAA